MKQTYLTYALNAEGKLVHIDSVPNGKACGCFCTFCGEALQAKQGAKRKHHFSHLSKTECEAAYESMLHLLAKEKIQEAFYKSTSFLLSLNIHRFAVKKNVFLCAILTDVVKKRERDLISNNGMTHVNRKSLMTTLEGEAT